MAHAAVERLNEYVRRKAHGTLTQPRSPDADLLRRVAAERDQEAFTALLRRHGPAVRAACRRVLGNSADADDAFQATFVVLWRSAGKLRRAESVAAWLYGSAHRIACQARSAAIRRRRLETNAATGRASRLGGSLALPVARFDGLAELSWREACAVLHEELDRLPDRYRLPLVLCYLHGLSRDEAAAMLGWSAGSVKGRLERGRERLRKRLTRRGIDLSAGLLAVVAEVEVHAAVPAALTTAAVEAAIGNASPAVAALVVASTRLMIGGPVALVGGLTVVAVALVALAAMGRPPAAPPEAPPAKPQAALLPGDMVTFRGRVVDPNGKPVPGARLFAYQRTGAKSTSDSNLEIVERAVADADGRFRFEAQRIPLARPGNQTDLLDVMAAADGFGVGWAKLPTPDEDLTIRLAPDQPIAGRILDTEGRPVAGTTVKVREVIRYRSGRLDGFLTGWQTALWHDAMYADLDAALTDPPASLVRATGPDRGGRFRIDGVGAERQVILDVKGPGLAQAVLYVMARSGFDLEPVNRTARQRAQSFTPPPQLYGPTLDYVVTPSKPIVGTVREAGSGRPVARAFVSTGIAYSTSATATADAAGHFRLDGLPKRNEFSVFVAPPLDTPLIGRSIKVTDTPGFEPLTVDVELFRGAVLTGRVVDRQTGRGVSADIHFYSLPDESTAGKPGQSRDRPFEFGGSAGDDGRFRLSVIPGPGVLTVRANSGYTEWVCPYVPAELDDAERKRTETRPQGGASFYLTTADGGSRYVTANLIKRFDVVEGTAPEPIELFVERGRTVAVHIEDPDGKPLPGTIVSGMTAMWPITYTLPKAECTLYALQHGKSRSVVFYHSERKLVGLLRVRGDETGPLTVRLHPAGGVVTGRVVDADGRPIEGAGVGWYYPEDESGGELFRYLATRGGPSLHTKSDADGRFRLDNVLPELRLDLGFKKGGANLTTTAGKYWFGPYRMSAGKTLDLGDLRTKPADR